MGVATKTIQLNTLSLLFDPENTKQYFFFQSSLIIKDANLC